MTSLRDLEDLREVEDIKCSHMQFIYLGTILEYKKGEHSLRRLEESFSSI